MPDDTPRRRDVWFTSGADRCHAWLYLPARASPDTPVPVIVMAHGLGAVKALRLSAYAERFTRRRLRLPGLRLPLLR